MPNNQNIFSFAMKKDGHYYIVTGREDHFGNIISYNTTETDKETYKKINRANHLARNAGLYGTVIDFLVTTAIRELKFKGGYHLWKGIRRSLR